MPKFIVISFLLLSHSAFAEEVFRCRYDLVGPATMPESVMEKNYLTVEACKQKAIELLKLNADNFNEVIIYPHDSKLIRIKLEDIKDKK